MTINNYDCLVSALISSCSHSADSLWNSILLGSNADNALNLLQKRGVIAEVFPELETMVGFGGDGHKKLWEHTLHVVTQAPYRIELRWAALWHDVGKVKCYTKITDRIAFHGHEKVSSNMFYQAAQRTGIVPKPMASYVAKLIRSLGLVEAYTYSWTNSAVSRLYENVGPCIYDCLDLSSADITTGNSKKREAVLANIADLRERLEYVKSAGVANKVLPKGLGSDISTEFSVEGPKLGLVLAQLKSCVLSGKLDAYKPISYYLAHIRATSIEKLLCT